MHEPQATLDWITSQPKMAEYADSLEDIESLAQLALLALTDEGSFFEAMKTAQSALQQFELEAGMRALIQAVMINKSYQNDLPRRSMISLFHFLGEQHPTSKKLRPHFNMALY